MNPSLLTTTQAVDPVFFFIIGASIVLLIGITVTMLWFVFRFRRASSPHPTSTTDGNIWLEIVWTLVPTLLVLAMFYYGWEGYLTLRNVPKGALEVTATARMWSWRFTYANGKTSDRLYIPVGRPVLVNLVSKDVIHGFYVPAFRVKRDVVPGMKNHVWFVATDKGSYDLFCSVYCGLDHYKMTTTIEAVNEKEFNDWLNRSETKTVELSGKKLLEEFGCLGCHSLDGTEVIGPTFKGLWGKMQTVTTSGTERSILVNEEYLRRSILDPQADVVKGFQPIMPANPGIRKEEIEAIIGFIKELGSGGK